MNPKPCLTVGTVVQKSQSHDLEVRVRFQPDARFLKNVRTIELTKLGEKPIAHLSLLFELIRER